LRSRCPANWTVRAGSGNRQYVRIRRGRGVSDRWNRGDFDSLEETSEAVSGKMEEPEAKASIAHKVRCRRLKPAATPVRRQT
jgi:hypothetical protein